MSEEPQEPIEEISESTESFFNTLKHLFLLMRIIMVVLVIALFMTGWLTVEKDKQVLSLRFNKIVGQHKPGDVYWIWPKPIGRTVILPSSETP